MASKLQLISCVRLGQRCNQSSSSINDGAFDKSSNVNLKAPTTLANRSISVNIFAFTRKQYVENFTLKHLLRFEICACEICEKFVYKH